MSFSHLTLPTQHVERTVVFFERTFGFARKPGPTNSPMETTWLDVGRGQEFHVTYVDGFEVSPFEAEFGRHIALFYPVAEFDALKQRVIEQGGVLVEQVRIAPFERFFFREPVNGYFFEVIDDRRASLGLV